MLYAYCNVGKGSLVNFSKGQYSHVTSLLFLGLLFCKNATRGSDSTRTVQIPWNTGGRGEAGGGEHALRLLHIPV